MEVNIVLADDHPLMLIGFQNFLEDIGFYISATANNGKKALDEIEKNIPTLAILDYQMPFWTGLEVAEIYLTKNIATRIILLTLFSDEIILKRARALNIAGFVLNEFAAEELLKCIRKVLEIG